MKNAHGRLAALALSCLIAMPVAVATAQQPPAAEQKVVLPDTPVGRMAKLYFAATESGDPDRIRAFLAEHFPSARNPDDFISVRQQTQGIDLVGIDIASDTRLELTVKTRKSGTLLNLILAVDAAPPHHFRTIAIML